METNQLFGVVLPNIFAKIPNIAFQVSWNSTPSNGLPDYGIELFSIQLDYSYRDFHRSCFNLKRNILHCQNNDIKFAKIQALGGGN